MSDQHLIVNVEEHVAKRLLDAGHPDLARQAIVAAGSLPNDTPLEALEEARYVPVTPEEVATQAEQAAVDAEARFRSERDARLAASDWTQLPDAPEGAQKKWAGYRQKLRDMPEEEILDMSNPDWPEPPA